jgi:hypothetical protein
MVAFDFSFLGVKWVCEERNNRQRLIVENLEFFSILGFFFFIFYDSCSNFNYFATEL